MDVPFGDDDRLAKDKREGERRNEILVLRVKDRSGRQHPVDNLTSLIPECNIPQGLTPAE